MGKNENPWLTPKKRSSWKKESNKQISLIITENKFELIETKSQESLSKQKNPKYPKDLNKIK